LKSGVDIIIEARSGSSRLPKKILRLINGKPMLYWQIKRLKLCRLVNKIIIATTHLPEDDPVAALACKAGVDFYRGSPDDVLGRVHDTAKEYGTEIIVEITGDNPLSDPSIVDDCINQFLSKSNNIDLMATDLGWYNDAFLKEYPIGISVKIFSFDFLSNLNKKAKLELDREHVINYAMQNSEEYKIEPFYYPFDKKHEIRLTVDYEEDFELITSIFTNFKEAETEFGLQDIFTLYMQQQDLFSINKGCSQKSYSY